YRWPNPSNGGESYGTGWRRSGSVSLFRDSATVPRSVPAQYHHRSRYSNGRRRAITTGDEWDHYYGQGYYRGYELGPQAYSRPGERLARPFNSLPGSIQPCHPRRDLTTNCFRATFRGLFVAALAGRSARSVCGLARGRGRGVRRSSADCVPTPAKAPRDRA